jgi:hypothetical protein
MTEQPLAQSRDEGARHYSLLCLAGLGVTAIALFLRGLETLALLPALAGVLAMMFRWRGGALVVLLVVAWLLAALRWPVYHPAFVVQEIVRWFQLLFGLRPFLYLRPALLRSYEGFELADVLLCGGVLTYVAAHCRLLSVTWRIFPADPRRRSPHDAPEERRSGRLVNGQEILVLLASLPTWVGLAWLCWRWVERKETELDIDDRWWRLMVLVWLFGLIFLVAAGALRYLGQRTMQAEEAALFLQDTLWRETSREQRRINRWIAWAMRKRENSPISHRSDDRKKGEA